MNTEFDSTDTAPCDEQNFECDCRSRLICGLITIPYPNTNIVLGLYSRPVCIISNVLFVVTYIHRACQGLINIVMY